MSDAEITGGLAADLCPGESDLIEDDRAFLARLLTGNYPRAHANPNHDSLFVRFEQLDYLLVAIRDRSVHTQPTLAVEIEGARGLLQLIRAEVLK